MLKTAGDPNIKGHVVFIIKKQHVLSESQKLGRGLTIACSEVGVSQATVFAEAAHDDGDAGEEEDQTYNDPRHHQRRHQERRLPS